MNLSTILSGVETVTVLAYLWLLVHLLRSGRCLALPYFTIYAGTMVVDLIWHPLTVREAIFIEPWLLTLRFCAVIEGAALLSDRIGRNQRKWLLVCLLCFGLIGSTRVAGLYTLSDAAGWYRTIRQTVHVGLALSCAFLCLFQIFNRGARWDARWLAHFRILSAYMIARAGLSFSFLSRPSFPSWMISMHDFGDLRSPWEYYAIMRIVALTTFSTILMVWLWYESLQRTATRRLEVHHSPL